MAHAPTSKTSYDPKHSHDHDHDHDHDKAEPVRHETGRREARRREVATYDGVEAPPALSLVPDSEYPLVRDEQIVRSEQALAAGLAAATEAAAKSAKK